MTPVHNPPADDRPDSEAVDPSNHPSTDAAPARLRDAEPGARAAAAPAEAAVLRRFRRGRWTLMPTEAAR